MLVFAYRNQSPKSLLFVSAGFFSIPILLYTMSGLSIPCGQKNLTIIACRDGLPDAGKIQEEIENMRGGWLQKMDSRVPSAFMMQTFLFFLMVFWRVMSMMLLGMALSKLTAITAQKSKAFYLRMAIICLVVGYFLSGWGVYENFSMNWKLADMFIFYGNGLGLFGQVKRTQQFLFVVGIWIVLLIISPLWLNKYRFGPLE